MTLNALEPLWKFQLLKSFLLKSVSFYFSLLTLNF